MTVLAGETLVRRPAGHAGDHLQSRDAGIDSMRGIAILMVIGLHSLPKHEGATLVTAIDAALRPCVPVFLFASGYLTARSGHIPLAKRIARALGPYTIAFIAAYLFMALENPLIDNRPAIFVARYVLAYVFVYYYVFVYVGCTLLLWLAFTAVADRPDRQQRLIALLSLAIVVGLAIGAYLDPLLQRFGVAPSLVEEARMRDVPFWFGFMAAGTIVGSLRAEPLLNQWRAPLLGSSAAAYAGYALVRTFSLGDSADYNSVAFFLYALLFCMTLVAFAPQWWVLSFLGAASYAVYLWHIFAIMLLRSHLPVLQPVAAFLVQYVAALAWSIGVVLTARSIGTPRMAQWFGA